MRISEVVAHYKTATLIVAAAGIGSLVGGVLVLAVALSGGLNPAPQSVVPIAASANPTPTPEPGPEADASPSPPPSPAPSPMASAGSETEASPEPSGSPATATDELSPRRPPATEEPAREPEPEPDPVPEPEPSPAESEEEDPTFAWPSSTLTKTGCAREEGPDGEPMYTLFYEIRLEGGYGWGLGVHSPKESWYDSSQQGVRTLVWDGSTGGTYIPADDGGETITLNGYYELLGERHQDGSRDKKKFPYSVSYPTSECQGG